MIDIFMNFLIDITQFKWWNKKNQQTKKPHRIKEGKDLVFGFVDLNAKWRRIQLSIMHGSKFLILWSNDSFLLIFPINPAHERVQVKYTQQIRNWYSLFILYYFLVPTMCGYFQLYDTCKKHPFYFLVVLFSVMLVVCDWS